MTILTGPTKPDGFKLEDLLAQLQAEVSAKSAKIKGDTRPTARQVLRNNQQIVGLLARAEALSA